jgi:hypothetical protein
MPKAASFTPQRAKWAAGRQWKVELPAGTTPSGKRERMFFGTKQDASNFCEEQRIRLKNHGTIGMSALNVGQLAQAAIAFETLRPYQVTLNSAWDSPNLGVADFRPYDGRRPLRASTLGLPF